VLLSSSQVGRVTQHVYQEAQSWVGHSVDVAGAGHSSLLLTQACSGSFLLCCAAKTLQDMLCHTACGNVYQEAVPITGMWSQTGCACGP
jgi:hypothetical protein